MKVAILLPLRDPGSRGFVKYIESIIPCWLKQHLIEYVSILCPEGTFANLKGLGVDIVYVRRQDYQDGFREMTQKVRAGNYDIALNTIARSVKVIGIPLVTIIQNVEPIQRSIYPMPIQWRLRLWALRREHAVACRQSTRIIALSNHVKTETCHRFNISPDLVDVVYFGFNQHESTASKKPGSDVPEGGFLFSAGSIVPYRGYEDVIRAIARFREMHGRTLHVVIAGNSVRSALVYERSLKKLAQDLQVSDCITWIGVLQREEMTWCYQNSTLFVQSSRAEAFSNIALEAMGNRCLTVSCDHPPMPELFHNSALYYTTGNCESLCAAIQTMLSMSDKEREDLRSRIKYRAAIFTWERTAVQTCEVLNHAIADYTIPLTQGR